MGGGGATQHLGQLTGVVYEDQGKEPMGAVICASAAIDLGGFGLVVGYHERNQVRRSVEPASTSSKLLQRRATSS
jgi:hypothetical protein